MNIALKAAKIAVGSTIAILLAYALHLNYAVAAGIITLLTLQDTKKATLVVAGKRILAFLLAMALSFMIFHLAGYHALAFGVFLLLFAGSCLILGWQDAIPVNAVLATHYLLDQSMALSVLLNESLLMVIGVGIGILLNLYIPKNVNLIRSKQREIEDSLKAALSRMADALESPQEQSAEDLLEVLKSHIDQGREHSHRNRNNTLFQESDYFVGYMEMRDEQYYVLKEISEKISTIRTATPQALEVAGFVRNIVDSLSESQNTKRLLDQEKLLLTEFKESPLPTDRDEFESRAVLYVVLMNFRIFLKMKKRFVDTLTEEQKMKYWDRCDL